MTSDKSKYVDYVNDIDIVLRSVFESRMNGKTPLYMRMLFVRRSTLMILSFTQGRKE